jgi:hypothetical protein
MKEEFIYFLWRYRLFNTTNLATTNGNKIKVINPGSTNYDSGPDFFAAQIYINDTLWAGNIEIHVNSSDWYKHGHQNDPAYGNIILHVVMYHDHEITDSNGNIVPVLELKNFYDPGLLGKYHQIISSKTWIPCEKFILDTSPVIFMNWLSRLLVERLENKAGEIRKFYEFFNHNWEQTFYYFLARNFGFKVNSSPFALLAQTTPYSILAKHKNDLTQLEALLFGQAGMLENEFSEAYPELLKKEYNFLRKKYNLTPMSRSLWKFGKMRPSNFPTLRISQFAQLIHRSTGLFRKIIESSTVNEISELLAVRCSPYWENHYTLGKTSSIKAKNLGDDAVINIIINTVVPLKFVYGNETMKPDVRDAALALLTELPTEKNSLITKWIEIGITPSNAGESQALIELKKYYCTPKKCLECSIGHHLIKSPPAK